MNPRQKQPSTTSATSLSRLDKNRSNLVSPTRNNNDKNTPPTFQGIDQSLANTKSLLSKNSSISLKSKTPSLSAAKGVTAQISLQDSKKQSGYPLQNDLLPNSSEAAPLPQLDISGIAPANDTIGQFSVNAQKNQLNSQGILQQTPISNNLNSSSTQPIKKISIQQQGQQFTSSTSAASNNLLQRSPSKVYQSTSGAQTLRKAESININNPINNNLIQSVNFGAVPSATPNTMLTSYNGNSTTQFTSNMNADAGNISADNKNAAATNTALENSINFEVLKQFDQKQKSSNIKTFIRVRPLNKMEIEFNENGCGNENLRYPDTKTIQVMPEKTPFCLDKIYPPGTQQEAIYEDVGKEMVNDVMQGYNGTIFAYGATGTGKTFTMFGDVGDETNKGIIPRVSNQIFSHIASVEQDIEFTITCSMLEIYKEQLFDLLKVDRVGLKIKENPQKGGIYVQGLTAISVDCQEEIIDSINLGYQSKQTRETRMNEYSSRSHTIFTINVTQRYPNGQEKTGKLNLVDLAGCEKVGKSGAVGETLEEAKKINLSLSCLGNVIHALTSNQEHIPYRDSKLTRILQESLGGNYKTSLIASLSPHSSQHEEQLSTLRFAARAKTIKNQVKMNVKLSLDQMRKLIEQLKTELEKAQTTNTRFRTIIKKLREELKASQMAFMQPSKDGKVTEQQQAMQNTVKAIEDMLNISDLDIDESGAKTDPNAKSNTSKVSYEDSELDESTGNNNPNNMNNLNNNSTNSYNNTNQNFYPNDPASADYNKAPSQFSGKRGGYQHRTLSNQIAGDVGNQKGTNLDFKAAYYEKVSECRNLDKELMDLKRQLLETERKVADSREEKHKLEYNHTQQITKNDYNKFEIEILQKQVQSLVDSICKSENTIGSLMKEKQDISQRKIDDFLKEKLNFSEIHFSEYFKKSINFNYDNLVQKWSDVQKNMKTIGLDDQELFKAQADFQVLDNDRNLQIRQSNTNFLSAGKDKPADDMIRGSFIGNLDFNQVSNPYDMLEEIVEFPGQLEKFSQQHPISRDLTIILLKKQLFNSHVINQHLARTINALEWKQIIEYGKAKMKSVLNKIQSKHIINLEQVINEASQNYRTLRNRIEQVELETQFVKEKIDSHQDNAPKKSKIIKDSESIRSLLMKPSNEGIRQSLRGSYIGFQLDLDKQSDSPIMKELKETDELLQKELLPLTYDRAIEELKLRNALVRKAYQEAKGGLFNGVSQDFVEQVLKEKERLEGKITILSNELKMESSKSEHYADAYKAEKQNFSMQKEQTKELELFLVNKMKEESEQIERSQKKISDSHEKEIMKYQQSFQRLSDCFSEYIRNSIARLSELKKQGDHVSQTQVEEMFKEMISVKEQYTKLFNPDPNSQGIGNGSESPSTTPLGYKFTPTSMIFRSFEVGADAHTPSSNTSKSRLQQMNPPNITVNSPNIVVNQPGFTSAQDEIKETFTDQYKQIQQNPVTTNENSKNNSNSLNYANTPVGGTTKPIQNTQLPPQVGYTPLQTQTLQSKSSLKPSPNNLTPPGMSGAVPISNSYTNASNANALSTNKPKLSTLPSTSLHQPSYSSNSNKTAGQGGLFSYRKY